MAVNDVYLSVDCFSGRLFVAGGGEAVEEGWEQSGMAGGARAGRSAGKAPGAGNALQRPDSATGAWGNVRPAQAKAAPQVTL